MATVIIQHRRGAYANFSPQDLKPGEWAVVQSDDPNSSDGKAIYICISAGVIKRIASIDELGDYDARAEQALADIRAIATNIDNQVTLVNQKSNEAATSASTAEQAKQTVNALVTNAESTIDTYTNTAIQRIDDAAAARAATISIDGIVHL